MAKKSWLESERLEVIAAILLAIVSLTTALGAWRINAIGSNADDLGHTGLIEAIKKQTSSNEDWRKLYEEAAYARDYSIYLAGVEVMESSQDAYLTAQAVSLRQYMLPNLQLLSSPLGTETKYLKPDGSYDLSKRIADLGAESPDLSNLDPQASFDLSKNYNSQKLWESIGLLLLALSLVWLTMAEISHKTLKVATLLLGLGIYLFGVFWFVAIEGYFMLIRGGLS
jgi:hypothetical protein